MPQAGCGRSSRILKVPCLAWPTRSPPTCWPIPSSSPARSSTSSRCPATRRSSPTASRRCCGGAPHLKRGRGWATRVMARTDLGRPQRVVLAGHLDTVPIAGNLPARVDGDLMYGCGTSDMKSGVALALQLAVQRCREPRYDVTYLFYEAEEIETDLQRALPGLQGPPGVAGGRLRGAARADVRRGRGGLPGHDAGHGHDHRPAGALGAVVARRQRDPRRGRGAAPARRRTRRGGSRSTAARTARDSTPCASTAVTPATSSRTGARSRSTTGSRRTGPARRPRRTCARSSRGTTWLVTDLAPGALPGLTAAPAQEFLAAVGAGAGRQARLDRRVPVRRAGHPGAELRPGRPQRGARASTSTWRSTRSATGAETLHRWLAALSRLRPA